MSLALSRAIYVVPVAFAAGMLLKDWRGDAERRAALIEKRVQQRLGEWAPPPLAPAVRCHGVAGARRVLLPAGRSQSWFARRASTTIPALLCAGAGGIAR